MPSHDPPDEPADEAANPEHSSGSPAEKFADVFEQVYAQLRAMAQQQISQERVGHTLHATDLVHQAYLRLFGNDKVDWANQRHFVYAAAEAMRRILIEHARLRGRQKRGGDRVRVSLGSLDAPAAETPLPEDTEQLLALDEALRRLEEQDPRAGDVVRLRFFAGLTIDQTAETLGWSPRTVKREWEFARAWLSQHLE